MSRLRRRTQAPTNAPPSLAWAFRTLGRAPSDLQLGLVADHLRESGVEVSYDEELVQLAEANGSSSFTALDLCTATAYGIENLRAGPRRRL